MELSYLINIVNDLTYRFEHPKLPYEFELKRELINLSEFEKKLLKNKVNNINYNIGALNILKMLNECKICSICEYLSNVRNEIEKLQIITDMLDDISSYVLLDELIESNRFNLVIDDCIKNYVNDLVHHQTVIKNEIISSMQKSLSSQNFRNCILTNFLNHLFHMDFRSKETTSLNDILSCQKDWNIEFLSFRVLKNVIENIMPMFNNVIVKEICNLIQNEKNICWFFILMAVSYVKEEYDGYVELKNLINSQINAFSDSNNINSLHKSFILSRQLYHYNVHKSKLSYQQWLKNNIGDLNYKLKNKKAIFPDIMQSLVNLIPFENDLDVLQIHIAVKISAPSKEYSNVMEYRQLLVSREDVLRKEDSIFTEDIL